MGFGSWFGLFLALTYNAKPSEKWNISNPWHAVTSKLIKILPAVGCKKVPSEERALGTKWLAPRMIVTMGYENCGMEMATSECPQILIKRK